jgi:glucosamine kinase
MSTEQVVIGVDGGGTYTRVLCADLEGNVLARTQAGGANPSKNADAEANIQQAIAQALGQAQRAPTQVVALVAGIAGLDEPADCEWAARFTTLPGCAVKPSCVNDAVVAWAGALALEPGIIIIAGTGCIIFGITETGREVRNYSFNHYAAATARHLTFATVFRILAGETTAADQPLIAQLLAYFGAATVRDLAEQAAQNAVITHPEQVRLYSGCAPAITAAAAQGTPLARAVCDAAVAALAQGVRIVGSLFEGAVVPYALIGGVAQASYLQQQVIQTLSAPTNKTYRAVTPAFSPETGAVLLGLQQNKIALTEALLQRLHDQSGKF